MNSEPLLKRAPITRRVMSATVEDELVKAVHERAAAEDRSASSVVRAALRAFLDQPPAQRDGR